MGTLPMHTHLNQVIFNRTGRQATLVKHRETKE
jgi:hypothetical protein